MTLDYSFDETHYDAGPSMGKFSVRIKDPKTGVIEIVKDRCGQIHSLLMNVGDLPNLLTVLKLAQDVFSTYATVAGKGVHLVIADESGDE